MLWGVLICILVLLLIQLWYWIRVIGMPPEKLSQDHTNQPSLCIIVAYRNERESIKKCISKLLQQDYAALQIIAIDDHSTDGGEQELIELAKQEPRLTLLSNTGKHGKKTALTQAINRCDFEWIAMTDADCIPRSDSWIKTAMSYASEGDVLLGYSPYRSYPGWLNRLIRYETWLIGIQYMSLLRYSIRYMAVGRNLFFRRSIFVENQGFRGHDDLASGSDDLFVHALPDDVRIEALTDPDTYVISEPKRTWHSLIRQKSRHVTTSVRYDTRTKLILGLISISHLGFYLLLLALGWLSGVWLPLVLWTLRAMVQLICINRAREVLSSDIRGIFVPILDVLLCLYYIIISFTYLRPNKKW